MTRVEHVEKLKKVFKQNIGKKIELNHYIRYESSTINEVITGTIEKCFDLEDLLVKTNKGIEFINIYHIVGYSL